MAGKDDNQITGAAGEFLAAGKLFKRGYQVSVTYGNAKAIDLFVHNPRTDRLFTVQVKTQRKNNCFPMRREAVAPDHVYVFVRLGSKFEQSEEFFIVPGKALLDNVNKFWGASYRDPMKPSSMPAVNSGPLRDYQNRWEVFDEREATGLPEQPSP